MTRPLILFTSLLLLTACNHKSDTEVRKNLPGTWHVDFSSTIDAGSKSTFTIATNGDFVCQTASSNGVHAFELVGTFQVKDGFLIENVTKSSQPNTHGSFVSRARIIEADDNEMVVMFDGAGGTKNKITIKKDTR